MFRSHSLYAFDLRDGIRPYVVFAAFGIGLGVVIGGCIVYVFTSEDRKQQANEDQKGQKVQPKRKSQMTQTDQPDHTANANEDRTSQEVQAKPERDETGEKDQPDHTVSVEVTLDVNTINPYLCVSKDCREVRWTDRRQTLPDTPERFDEYPCVLGTIGLNKKGCYWEVEVGGKMSWELGVATDLVHRKGQLTLSPQTGFWVLSLWDGKLTALTDPETPLDTDVPRRVGIDVNYEEKKIRFYNVDEGTIIYTFQERIDRTVRPFFSPGSNDQDPLIIIT
nr:PREDICTED: E3 ubiquitin-protein ligase TRIM21-like isoform X3 [Lepisosteus oculatus]XP_015201567.1 PREDICTED: E3 ubiquitin-protein ligase TRIM21-like isoform X3 [Lepisosteus oculatus]